jgi:Cys-rich protein (TIGR01571 family)
MQPEQPQVMMVPQPQVMMMAPQPQVILMQNTPAKKEPKTGWHTGLYECGNDVPVCLFSFCCTPCAYGMLVEMNLEDKADASPPCGNFGACCTVFCLQAYCPCVVCFVTSQNRGQIRTKHNLKVRGLRACGPSHFPTVLLCIKRVVCPAPSDRPRRTAGRTMRRPYRALLLPVLRHCPRVPRAQDQIRRRRPG